MVEKREAPAEAAEAPEAQDQTEDEEAAVEPRPMIEVGFCKFSLRVTNVCRETLPPALSSLNSTLFVLRLSQRNI